MQPEGVGIVKNLVTKSLLFVTIYLTSQTSLVALSPPKCTSTFYYFKLNKVLCCGPCCFANLKKLFVRQVLTVEGFSDA